MESNEPELYRVPTNANTIYDRAINYINGKYEIRFNAIALQHEISLINSRDWHILNFNSLMIELSQAGIEISASKLEILMGSNLISHYNPIKFYFNQLPKWDGIDHIKHLCNYIKTKDDKALHYHFEKWLARAVLCAIKVEYVNKQCIVFTSTQNVGKSTFLRFLIPKELTQYYMEDLTLDKDGIIALCKNLIINLDELAAFKKFDINTLKSYISRGSVNTRLPYARKNQILNRICSFVGSSNLTEFLTDGTGSVRWLIFEIENIDFNYATNIDINKIWAQSYYNAVHNSSFDPNLTTRDIEENELRNEKYRHTSPEEDFLKEHFEKSEHLDDFTTPSELSQLIYVKSGQRFSDIQLGKALKYLQYERIKHTKRQIYGYRIRLLKSLT